jgi:hypothetical protein
MRVNCAGCAGCCVDWRPVAPAPGDHERRGPHRPLDDVYNLVPLTRDEVRAFLEAGYGDAMVPRLWRVDDGGTASATGLSAGTVTVDGIELAAIGGRPAFFVGLRKPPKPVAPFGGDRRWLDACAFLDPETLQCRLHGGALYPDECREYPGHNLVLGRETECERVESAFDGPARLLEDDPPDGLRGLLLGPHALGAKVFAHPDPAGLDGEGTVARLQAGEATARDRARFVAVAAASRPGSIEVDPDKRARADERARRADSWVGRAVDEWRERAGRKGSAAADAPTGATVEDRRGAPGTPGWDAVRERADGDEQ